MPAKETCLGLSVSKRLLREAFRRVCGDLKGGYAIVLIPKQAESYTLAQFEKSMRSAFARENLFR